MYVGLSDNSVLCWPLHAPLQLIRGFSKSFASLFTFTAEMCAQDVQDAVFVRDNSALQPGDDVT